MVGQETGFDDALRVREGRDVEPLRTLRGTSLLYRLRSDVVVSRARGHIDPPHIQHLIDYCDSLLKTVPTISIFHDWFAVDTYDSQTRRVMTPWAIATRDRHRVIHIGVTSKVVRMGISVVVMASQAPIHTHANIGELAFALEGALRARSSIAPPPSNRG